MNPLAPAFRRLPLAAACLSLSLAWAPALAAESPAKAGAAPKLDVKPGPAKAAELKPEPAPEPGSLDAIREKLAAKLGAGKPLDPNNPRVVKVAARATGEFQVAAGKPTARKVATRRDSAPVTPGRGASQPGVAWGYQGEAGPERWGTLKPEFAACGSGARQSPIDIRDGIAVDLEPIAVDYRPGGFSVIDTGHTVRVEVGPGNSVEVMGRRYALQHVEFRHPGEERIDGRAFEMSMHLMHRDPEGRLAGIAVLLERGAAQPVVQTVWNNLPLEKGELLPARVELDPARLLPDDRRYYTYMGSLTTPPCSEGVLWMVMQQPVTVSPAQIDIFARLYPMNARPIQAAAGRLIKQSN
jgi:carbonic anhydrase